MKKGRTSAKQHRNLVRRTPLGLSLELGFCGSQHRPLGLRLPLRVLEFFVKGSACL